MKRVSAKAVIVGGILDLSVTFAVGILIGIVLLVTHDLISLSPASQELALRELMRSSSSVLATTVLLGCGSSVLAGYVSGRIAGHDWLLNGALSATLCSLFAVYSIVSGTSPLSRIVSVALLPLGPLLGGLGGYFALRRAATVNATRHDRAEA